MFEILQNLQKFRKKKCLSIWYMMTYVCDIHENWREWLGGINLKYFN